MPVTACYVPFRATSKGGRRHRPLAALLTGPAVKETSLIQTHADDAEGLAPWVFVLFIVAVVLLWWNWNEREATAPRAPKWVALVLAVTAVLAATGTIVQAVLVGHSGATATWSQVVGSPTHPVVGGSGKG